MTADPLRLPIALVAAGLGLGAGALGSGGPASSAAAAGRPDRATPAANAARRPPSVTLRTSANRGGRLAFTTTSLSARAGRITIHMRNPGTTGLQHGIAVAGRGVSKTGSIVSPGHTASVSVRLKPGTYTFFCPVPGHRAAGMRGTLVVR